MKKFLSLVLALVMTMSLVTISAGAKDFTDDSTIKYEEAVDVISALKVVEGYPDGSFGPTKGLTRAEAAKIICNMILGPTTAAALVADAAPFKDVPTSHWAAGYIAFCTKEGIIDGYGDGNFGPSDALTGYAYMKLLLGALGYDKDIEGYTGANWSINVAKRALNIGLDDGLVDEFNGVKVVTREEAVLFAFNALTADMVEYGNKTTITVGGTEVVVGAGEAKTIGLSNAKDYRESEREDRDGDAKLQFCEKYFSKLTLKDTTGATDDFGRPANTWFLKNDKIGTYAKTADKTYRKDVAGKNVFKDLELDKNAEYEYDVVVDGKAYTDVFQVKKANDDKMNDAIKDAIGRKDIIGKGSLVEVFEDDEVITVVNTFLMKVDGDYDEDDEALELVNIDGGLGAPLTRIDDVKLSSDDYAGLDEFKDGDIVAVTVAYDEDEDDYVIKTLALAESVTATVTEYVDADTVTADGKEYSYNVTADADDNATNYQYAIKEEAVLYLDDQGNVLWAKGVEAEDNYMFVTEFSTHTSSSKSPIEAYAYTLEGEEISFTVNKFTYADGVTAKVSGADDRDLMNDDIAADAGAQAGAWVRFTKKTDGKYDLTVVGNVELDPRDNDDDEPVIVDYKADKTALGDSTEVYANKTTKFIIVDEDGDISVYTGIKNAPKTIVDGDYTAKAVKDGATKYAKYVFIDVADGSVEGGAASGDLVFILTLDATYGHDSDSDSYYRYKAIVNGEEKKIKSEVGEIEKEGALYTKVEYNSKGYISKAKCIDDEYAPDGFTFVDASGLTVVYKNNTIVLSDDSNFYLADNAKIYLITDGDEVATVSATKLAKEYKTDAFAAGSAVYGVTNSEDEYTALYVYDAE